MLPDQSSWYPYSKTGVLAFCSFKSYSKCGNWKGTNPCYSTSTTLIFYYSILFNVSRSFAIQIAYSVFFLILKFGKCFVTPCFVNPPWIEEKDSSLIMWSSTPSAQWSTTPERWCSHAWRRTGNCRIITGVWTLMSNSEASLNVDLDAKVDATDIQQPNIEQLYPLTTHRAQISIDIHISPNIRN